MPEAAHETAREPVAGVGEGRSGGHGRQHHQQADRHDYGADHRLSPIVSEPSSKTWRPATSPANVQRRPAPSKDTMATVTIENIEAIALSIPFDHWGPPPIFAGRPRTTMDALLVRVTASNGVVGWGEAFWGATSTVVAALNDRVAPLARGQDVNDAELTPRLERVLHNLGRAGPVTQAMSGRDVALWDTGG